METVLYDGDLPRPIEALKEYFLNGGTTLVQAAFAHSYFINPDSVRENPVYYPGWARRSRGHYPGLDKGESAIWSGSGREVKLDYNQRAQMAWERYTGRRLARGTGYSLRHIWGQPWNPDAFTAGWNLCYMPYWAGMLTETQNLDEELEEAVRQASWDLYFRTNPVCSPPEFVKDPGSDLDSLLDGQPILILRKKSQTQRRITRQASSNETTLDTVKEIRRQTRRSWVNIRKAARSLQEKEHEPFGSKSVESTSKSTVRRMCKETGLTLAEIEAIATELG